MEDLHPDPLPDDGRAAELRAQFRLPWPSRRNAHAREHEGTMREEAVELGLLADDPADHQRFANFIMATAFFYPRAPLPLLNLAGSYVNWLHFIDDQYDDHEKIGRDIAAVRAIMERALAILASGALPPAPTPFDRLTQRIHQRLAVHATEAWSRRFLASVRAYLLEGSLVTLARWAGGVVPSVAEYLPVRLIDSAVLTCFDLMELLGDVQLDPELLDHPHLRAMRLAAGYHIVFVNDMVSYHKEVVEHGQVSNLVHILMVEERLPLVEALRRVKQLADGELVRFLAAEAALAREIQLTSDVVRYIDGLKDWISGNVDFSIASPRFRWPPF